MAILAAGRGVHSAVSSLAQVSPTGHPSGPATGTPGPADDGTAAAIWGVLDAIGKPFHLNGLGVLCALGLIGWLISQAPKLPKRTPKQKETDEAIGKAFKAVFAALGRFLVGRPIGAKTAARKKEAGASFWNNALPEPEPLSAPPAEMGAIAMPGAVAGPDFREVLSDRLVGFTDWVGALPVPRLLVQASDIGAIVAWHVALAGRWAGRGLRGVLMLPVALWRGVASYSRWAYVSVLTARAAVPGGWALYVVAPDRVLTGLAVAGIGTGVAAFTGPDGLGKWHGPKPSDDQLYGRWLWSMLKAALRLPLDAQKEDWLAVPPRLDDEGAQVVLMLPEDFRGTPRERADLDEIVNLRLPGDWVSQWRLMGGGHKAVWTARRAARELVGDEATYGPALWPILHARLGLDDDELMEDWLTIPADVSDRQSVVRLELPLSFVGGDVDRQELTALLNLKVPGDWVAKWQLKGGQRDGDHWVEWTHRPPAPPAPEPPDAVDINDPRVLAALAKLSPEEFLLGLDDHHDALIRKLSGETPHLALSVGTGGGKSAKLQWLAVQMVMKRGTIIGVDPKMVSLKPLRGIPGVHLYSDPQNAVDMRRVIEWLAEVTVARFYEKEQGLRASFDPIYLILEESNELVVLLKQAWENVRVKKGEDRDSSADPIWREAVGKILRLGRDANVHIIAVFQDFKDNEFGGASLTPLFRLKALGNYEENQWKRIFGSVPMPPSKNKAGRMAIVAEGKAVRYQVPFTLDALTPPPGKTIEETSETIYHQLYLDLRERHGYEPDGLYSAPPANSPRGIPKLLQGRLSPPAAGTAQSPESGRSGGIVPAQRVTLSKGDGLYDTSSDGGGDALRDALEGLLTRQGQGADQVADQAPAEPAEELLSLAEISRRLEAQGIIKAANTMTANKRRRKDFPAGQTDEKGKTKYTYSEIYAYYEGLGEFPPAAPKVES
ncbi:hypothetical protein ACIQWA_40545 [Kitasatospora sp. NPDC098652]|uniref:hypothetical protein n=1 Tax=Kitasatospora sp. NPDC098652 TaxID=3364095 RepID=UPI0038212BE8